MHYSYKNDTRRILFLMMRNGLLLLSISIVYSRNLVQASNLMPPLLHYDFTMDNCHTGRFRNAGRLDPNTANDDSIDLIRNPTVTSCIYGIGIEFESSYSELPFDHSSSSSNNDLPLRYSTTGKSLYSSKPMEVVLNALDNDAAIVGQEEHGITLSFWIRPHPMHSREKTYGEDRSSWTSPILTIGSSDVRQPSSSAPNGLSSCATSNLDFQISMIEDHKLEVVYRTNDPDAEPCQRIEVPLPSRSIATTRLDDDEEEDRRGSSVPVHIMIALTDYNQRVFVNGRNEGTRMIERFDPNLHHWNPQSILQFFTYSSTENYPLITPPWEGQLFQFSLYRGALEKEQVRSVLSDGLPPSQPLAHQKVVTIQEDANDDDRYTQEIATSYTFLDTEMESLFALLDLPHQHAATVRHYITRFPSRGSLFHPVDRHKIEPEGTLPVFVDNAERLVYIPLKDEHSDFRGEAYTTFEYCVTTTKIIASSQCVSVTISVVVDPVNDPPVASSLPTYSVYEGVIKEDTDALLLSGSDVDEGDFIQCIQITAPPKMGYLFLSVSSFRKEDNLRHGTLLSTIHNTISGNEAYVEYRFTDYTTTVLQGTSVADYFKFRVQDSTGTWSTEREVRIQISSSVYSYVHSPDESDHWMTNMTQVGGTFHEIVGQDVSGLNRTNGFIFISLPTKGVLRDEHGVSIQQNQIIKSHSAHINDGHVKMERINLNYVGIPNLCRHNDALFLNDNLRYQVVAMDATNDIVSVSSIKEVQVTVVCAREPLSMELIEQNESNIVSEFTSRFDDNCSGYMFDFTNESRTACNTVAFVFGFHVKNTETLTQPVLVSMTSSTGLLSLQKDYFSDVHPFDDQLIMRPELYFLSPPEKLRGILSAIHFQSDSIGSTEIRIVFQFGDCQHSYLRDHEFSPPTTDCHQTDIRIPVMVQHNRDGAQGYKYPFPWVSLLLILLLGVVLYLKGLVRETLQNIQAVAFQKWKQCRKG